MRLYCTSILFSTSYLAPCTLAWITSAPLQNRAPSYATTTQLDAITEPTSSRRTWFSQAAAIALTVPTVAQASTPAVVEKPVSGAVCDTAVSVWTNPQGRKVFLLGTAHISSQSADVAGQLVRDVKPDAVFVELDAKRIGRAGTVVPTVSSSDAKSTEVATASQAPPQEALSSTTIRQPESKSPSFALPKLDIRQRALQVGSVAVGNAIKGMYSKLNSSGFSAGEEFVVAIREGQKLGSAIVLGDRDVEVTLKRLTEALAQTDLKELMNPDSELERSMTELLPGKPPSPDMGDAEFRQEMSSYVETMKAKDNVRKIMKELKKAAPAIYTALVEERDNYMGRGLDSINQFSTTVAVMGIAHMEGVEQTLEGLGWREVPLKCSKV